MAPWSFLLGWGTLEVRHGSRATPAATLRVVVADQVWTGRGDEAQQRWDRATRELENALEVAARDQRLFTYTDLVSEITAFPLDPRSPELARLLCERTSADVEADRPLLSSIVIGRRTNRPGKGFFQFARQYFRIEDDEVFWLGEVASVHDSYRRMHRRARSTTTAPHRIRLAKVESLDTASEKDFIMSFFD
jgi:hypothetical protein